VRFPDHSDLGIVTVEGAGDFRVSMDRVRDARTEALWTDPHPRTPEGRRLLDVFIDRGARDWGVRDLGQRICQIENEAVTLDPRPAHDAALDFVTLAQHYREEHDATHGEAEMCGGECIVLGLTDDPEDDAALREAAQDWWEADEKMRGEEGAAFVFWMRKADQARLALRAALIEEARK
jgi:hypothetical protein